MNAFVNAIVNQEDRTQNGMKTRKSSGNGRVDLFYKIGAMRGQNVIPTFVSAYANDRDLALRIVAWARDVRGGAGERQIFRDILKYLEVNDKEAASALMYKIPELGRWDDLFVFSDPELKKQAFNMLGDALRAGNGLAAKWTPRKGPIAVEIRKHFGMSPKFYRKYLVKLTNVVETAMCAKKWDDINFSHVPSLAAARYKKAFNRNTPKYAEYVASLVKGDDNTVKVHAGAVFPYDVLKRKIGQYVMRFNATETNLIIKQWEALPNYVGDADILPMVDVSGSMSIKVGRNPNAKLSCLDVAVSLGLYLADKNKGSFKDTFLTFSGNPQLLRLRGNVVQKIDQMVRSKWEMNTNLHAAFDNILSVAKIGNVSQKDMPKIILILSDMQFDECIRFDDSAYQMIERKYRDAGYEMPKVVFWNLNAYDNVPVKFDKNGTALVSGFSPAIVKSLLAGDLENFTPEAIMLKTIMQDRYAVL